MGQYFNHGCRDIISEPQENKMQFFRLSYRKNPSAYSPYALNELKGLSHEIDFKNFDKNLQNLA